MNLDFLRKVAAGPFPRSVPPGPAFEAVVSYVAAGYLIAEIPPGAQSRSGTTTQPDLRVIAITPEGQKALDLLP